MTALGVGLAVAAASGVGNVPWAAAERERRRRALALTSRPAAELPSAGEAIDVGVLLELVAAALRSGAAVPRALLACADALGGADGVALTAVAAALRLGAPWGQAWAGVPPRLDVVGRALRPAWEEGAAPGDALRAAGDALRRERRDAARVAAARLGVRLVLPLGTCFLPAFVLVGLAPVLIALGVGVFAG